jgi:hypothetical protein
MAIPVIGAIGWKAALGLAGVVGAVGFGAGALMGAEAGGDKVIAEPGSTVNVEGLGGLGDQNQGNGNPGLFGDLGGLMNLILPILMLKMLF